MLFNQIELNRNFANFAQILIERSISTIWRVHTINVLFKHKNLDYELSLNLEQKWSNDTS